METHHSGYQHPAVTDGAHPARVVDPSPGPSGLKPKRAARVSLFATLCHSLAAAGDITPWAASRHDAPMRDEGGIHASRTGRFPDGGDWREGGGRGGPRRAAFACAHALSSGAH